MKREKRQIIVYKWGISFTKFFHLPKLTETMLVCYQNIAEIYICKLINEIKCKYICYG